MKQKGTVRRILVYLKHYRLKLILILLAALISVPLGLLAPILIGNAIDYAVGPGQVDFSAVLDTLVLLMACIVASVALSWAVQSLTRDISARVSQDMRRAAFKAINKAPISKLDTNSQGDLVSRLVNDADAVAEGLMQAVAQLIPGAVTIIATLVVMCMLNFPIALIVIVVTPLSILFARFVGVRTSRFFRKQAETQGAISGYINEMVGNQAVIQAFNYEGAAEQVFSGLADDYYEANFKATFYSSIGNPGTRFVNSIVYMAVGIFGSFYAISGGITVGGLSAFLNYANQYTKPFNEVTAVLTQIQGAISGAKRLFDVIDWKQEPPDAEEALSPTHSDGNVKAEHVYFSYQTNKPLLQDLNFSVKHGQRIALVGPTGCGKTTLINLLMRFYDIDSGEIFLDGNSIQTIKRDALRKLHGMVLQETWLKEATVHENIAYAKPNASRAEVEVAARTARAHSFISRLQGGYDTVITAGGANLSAGQRQLLCIARIVLAQPDIFILDEATSSIDTRTEISIQRALNTLMTDKTSFIVAHRLSTIQNADLILVMDAGRIVERGTHETLLDKNGFYARIFKSQFAES